MLTELLLIKTPIQFAFTIYIEYAVSFVVHCKKLKACQYEEDFLSISPCLGVFVLGGCTPADGTTTPNPSTKDFHFIPVLPSALSGDGTIVAARSPTLTTTEERLATFGQFIIVPETSIDYNGTVTGLIQGIKDNADQLTWVSIASGDFTRQAAIPATAYNTYHDIIIRSDADLSSFEPTWTSQRRGPPTRVKGTTSE